MKKILLLFLFAGAFLPISNFACTCAPPPTFCDGLIDSDGNVIADVIVRGKIIGDKSIGKEVRIDQLIFGDLNQNEITMGQTQCTAFFGELENGAEYVFALKEFNGNFFPVGCARFFLKIEREVVKGKIAPGTNSIDYKDLGDLKDCGNAFEGFAYGSEISIFPNPTDAHLQLKNNSEKRTFDNFQLKVYDMLGREIDNFSNQEGILPEETWEINIRHLAAGVYIFQLSGRSGERNFRIVKQGV